MRPPSWDAWRGIATRCDRTPRSYLAGLYQRASMIWLKDLTRTPSQYSPTDARDLTVTSR